MKAGRISLAVIVLFAVSTAQQQPAGVVLPSPTATFPPSQLKPHRWVLPVADGGEATLSTPSVHGYIASATKGRITVKRDSRDPAVSTAVVVQLTPKTQLFNAYGGAYDADQLRAGQYVWIWYITADPEQAGTPPHAAVVVLWSTSPSDKPSSKDRWSYDRSEKRLPLATPTPAPTR